jgi:hypothetical protein
METVSVSGSTRVCENPASRIQAWQSAPVKSMDVARVERPFQQIMFGAIPPRAAQNPKINPFCARYFAPRVRAMFAGVPVNIVEIAQPCKQ